MLERVETGEENVIINGLSYACNKGWNTPEKAIVGGLGVIKNYITRGQDTPYYQKFNVVYGTLYQNQYAQNVLDARSVGEQIKEAYIQASLINATLSFNIPLYSSMPAEKCLVVSNNLQEGELVYINSNPTLLLRDSPSKNGNCLGTIANGTIVSRIEMATSKIDGYYWDKVSTSIGIGYMAREASDGSKTYLVPVYEERPVDTSINNGYSVPDENNIIKTEPNVTVNKIKETYTTAVIKNKNGEEITGDTLIGTGAKIIINGIETYTIVKIGDVSGDGKISPSDYVKVKNHIMGVTSLDEVSKKSADINKDGQITPADYVKIKNHIMSVSTITL